MNEDWKIKANKRIKESNAKKKAIRNRLSANCVRSIDDCIKACENIHDSLVNTAAEGYLCVNLHEIVELRNSVNTLRFNFGIEEEVI